MPIERKTLLGFGLALLVLLAIGVVSFYNIRELVATTESVAHSHEVLEKVNAVMSSISEVQGAARGYVITGKEEYLGAYRRAAVQLAVTLTELRPLTKESADQQRRLDQLQPLVAQRVASAEQVIETRRNRGSAAVVLALQAERDQLLTDSMRFLVDEMQAEERNLLVARQAAVASRSQRADLILVLGSLSALGVVALAVWTLVRDSAARRRADEELRQSREDLAALVNDLQLRSLEINRLSEISDLLQSCQNPQEAYEIAAHTVPKMFPATSGALYVYPDAEGRRVMAESQKDAATSLVSANVVEAVATWGPAPPAEKVFAPDDCWALRRGRPHFARDSSVAQRCRHVGDSAAGSHLCVPMLAHGEAVGILYFHAASPGDLPSSLIEGQQRLALTVGEQVGLALANLKLRETLRQQSIRDLLTGLFNRRYMEESLDRELRRAVRNSRPMAVLMLDIDHFKSFNDNFGHEAGDILLAELGLFLSANVRGDDIACRYGGEEFALILPEASLESAQARAEWLRQNVKQMQAKHRGNSLGVITISLGVAAYPDHDSTPRGLLHAADQALYRAKREGRDRVVLAPVPIAPEGPLTPES